MERTSALPWSPNSHPYLALSVPHSHPSSLPPHLQPRKNPLVLQTTALKLQLLLGNHATVLLRLLEKLLAFVLRDLGLSTRLLLSETIDLRALPVEIEDLLPKAFFDASRAFESGLIWRGGGGGEKER